VTDASRRAEPASELEQRLGQDDEHAGGGGTATPPTARTRREARALAPAVRRRKTVISTRGSPADALGQREYRRRADEVAGVAIVLWHAERLTLGLVHRLGEPITDAGLACPPVPSIRPSGIHARSALHAVPSAGHAKGPRPKPGPFQATPTS